ncbi:MAG: neutral zinc metallopeptidase [Myxococcaceae bacterium]
MAGTTAELERGGPARVIAHEVGHHVQNLLGTFQKVQRQTTRGNQNALSVKMELQADCYAGIWAHHAQQQRHVLDPGDIEEGLNAASQIGDDTLQKKAQGYVAPESFTHGTSAQRVSWFKRGFESGRLEDCDTFAK